MLRWKTKSSSPSPESLAWPEPPQLLELHLPGGYSAFQAFAVIVDKVDHGRVLVVEHGLGAALQQLHAGTPNTTVPLIQRTFR